MLLTSVIKLLRQVFSGTLSIIKTFLQAAAAQDYFWLALAFSVSFRNMLHIFQNNQM